MGACWQTRRCYGRFLKGLIALCQCALYSANTFYIQERHAYPTSMRLILILLFTVACISPGLADEQGVAGSADSMPSPSPEAPQAAKTPNGNEGSSNKEAASSPSQNTPLGRYRKKVADAIGARWYEYVTRRADLISSGSIRVKFYITKDGHAEDVKVLSNDANEELLTCSMRSIETAKIPPIPPGMESSLEKGRYEVKYTFTIHPDEEKVSGTKP